MQESSPRRAGATCSSCRTSAWRSRGSSTREYQSKESLAQQGGYALTNKGPQHDEAWLIFMDMVNNQIPTFEDKAEALHYFPLFRTWFGLMGLCKLPWNDIEPADNAKHGEERGQGPRARPELPGALRRHHRAAKSRSTTSSGSRSASTTSSACSTCGWAWAGARATGRRTASMGPVTKEEYESRAERYDKQLKELIGIDPDGQVAPRRRWPIHREWREGRYNKLCDAVYARRGWTNNAIPTLETLKKFKIDFPEVVAVVTPHL